MYKCTTYKKNRIIEWYRSDRDFLPVSIFLHNKIQAYDSLTQNIHKRIEQDQSRMRFWNLFCQPSLWRAESHYCFMNETIILHTLVHSHTRKSFHIISS